MSDVYKPELGAKMRREALGRMREALCKLDEACCPAHIGAYLDQAIVALEIDLASDDVENNNSSLVY